MSHPSNGQKCTGAEPLADEAQPRDASVGGFRHRPLHVEMKDRFRAAGTLLSQPPPVGVAHTRSTVAPHAVANEVDVDVLVSRPMPSEIVEERGPVREQVMRLEI